MNLAIVIATSKYVGKLGDLPACSKDSAGITSLLKIVKKFDNQLVISDDPKSASVKEKLVQFIEAHKGQPIDEVFFYYTGHGEFTGEEFYYLLSDFKSDNRRQTSLENSELDELLRSLNPDLSRKVIDACNAGIPYIKDMDSLGSYLKGTGGKFRKCYFLFSSQVNQPSYQDENLSIFTRSFLEAMLHHSANTIRYKDIMDYVADSFASDAKQNPFFVVQADLTETFCQITDRLRSELEKLLPAISTSSSPQTPAAEQLSLSSFVKKDAERYCSKEEASHILEHLVDMFRKHPKSKDMNELYDIELETANEYTDFINLKSIGKWAKKYQQDYFIAPVHKQEKYYEEVTDYGAGLDYLSAGPIFDIKSGVFVPREEKISSIKSYLTPAWKKKKVERKRSVIVGVRSTTDMPYQQITITAKPKYPNLETGIAVILPFVSRTTALIFHGVTKYRRTGWGEEEFETEFEWKVSEVGLKDAEAMHQFIERMYSELEKLTLLPLEKYYGLIPEEDKDQPTNHSNDSKDGSDIDEEGEKDSDSKL